VQVVSITQAPFLGKRESAISGKFFAPA